MNSLTLKRLEAYRVKCMENARAQGKSEVEVIRAFIYSEPKAWKVILGDDEK